MSAGEYMRAMVREYEARMCRAVFPHDWSRHGCAAFVRALLTAGECELLYTFRGVGNIAGRRFAYVTRPDGTVDEYTAGEFRRTFGIACGRCGAGYKLGKKGVSHGR